MMSFFCKMIGYGKCADVNECNRHCKRQTEIHFEDGGLSAKLLFFSEIDFVPSMSSYFQDLSDEELLEAVLTFEKRIQDGYSEEVINVNTL